MAILLYTCLRVSVLLQVGLDLMRTTAAATTSDATTAGVEDAWTAEEAAAKFATNKTRQPTSRKQSVRSTPESADLVVSKPPSTPVHNQIGTRTSATQLLVWLLYQTTNSGNGSIVVVNYPQCKYGDFNPGLGS